MIRLLELEDDNLRIRKENDHRKLLNDASYAILSHRWRPLKEEVIYPDIREGRYLQKPGYKKIEYCGIQARKDNCQFFWVDTCAIKKKKESELAEALNSMYMWYADAKICYVYLEDVNGKDLSAFEQSEWFKRGWTLQELMAPKTVQFYSSDWVFLGDKSNLGPLISKITGIDQEVLHDSSKISNYSVAERISWAAGRRTGRVEDRAYSLMGIFGIDDMPMMYGQGDAAFRRLQEKIMSKSNDQSIFAWRGIPDDGPSLMATSPDAFGPDRSSESDRPAESIKPKQYEWEYKHSKVTVEISLRLDPCGPYTYRGLLNCANPSGDSYAIYVRQLPATKKFARVKYNNKEFEWVPQYQANQFQPLEKILIYHDITDFKKFHTARLSSVPSMSFHIPEKILSVSYEAKTEHYGVIWDASRRVFTITPGVEAPQGMIGSLRLEDNDFNLKVVRVGFDRNSNPVGMFATSLGLNPSSVGKKIGRFALSFLWAPPIFLLTLAFLAATRANILPRVHKGKGLLKYAADEGEEDDEFWDYDTVRSGTSSGNLIMDRQDRLGLWLVRGDRSLPTPVEVTMLAYVDFAMKNCGGRKTGPAMKMAINYDPSTGPYTWRLDMSMTPFPHKQFYQLRNQSRRGQTLNQDPGANLGRDMVMGKYGPG